MYNILSLHAVLRSIRLSDFKYRDRTKIVVDILDSISSEPKGKTKTSIMRSVNLNLNQANTYLRFLMILGLVKPWGPLKSCEVARYRLTTDGLRLIKDIQKWRYVFVENRPV